MENIYSEALVKLLTHECSAAIVRRIEDEVGSVGVGSVGAASSTANDLWKNLEASGFADALLSEDDGGAALSASSWFPLVAVCGQFALPLPLVHTQLARAMLVGAGIASPTAMVAIAELDNMRAPNANVAYGKLVEQVLVQLPMQANSDNATMQEWVLMPVALAQMNDSVFVLDTNMQWADADLEKAPRFFSKLKAKECLAMINAALLSGAMTALAEMTLNFANQREQFGRPIGKFQAIQHQLSVLFEQAFASRMAAALAFGSARSVLQGIETERVAMAKARCSEAAVEVAAISHSIHGAIGFTSEFDLQLLTRRLHHWRQSAGSEAYWQEMLGKFLLEKNSQLTLDSVRLLSDTDGITS